MARKLIYIIALITIANSNYLFSQSSYLPLSNEANFYYEDLIYNETENFHTSIKPYLTREITYKAKTDSLLITKNNSYLFNSHLIKKESDNFNFYVDPIINSFYSLVSVDEINDGTFSFGLAINSDMGKKLAFNFNYFTSASRYGFDSRQQVINSSIVPHFGKSFDYLNGFYFYNNFSGSVSYSPSKYINFQAGQGKNFFGDGYRSLLLSDNANVMPFVKASVNIWKIKYIVLYQIMKDINSDYNQFSYWNDLISIAPYHIINNTNLESKYATSHYLSWNLNKIINLNLFETVIWRGGDSLGFRGYDINYLNPIIFFRPVEFSLGSPDNVIMGGGGKIKIAKRYHLYGQFVLDEFKLDEVKAKTGWWGNKFGLQAGFKSFDFLKVKGLYIQTEANYVRPFTYSHGNSLENHGHYFQSNAHPLGANLEEVLFIAKYKKKRSVFLFKTIIVKYGTDKDSLNVGQNIYRSYNDNRNEYGNYILQGNLQQLIHTELKYSYLLNPKWNLTFEFGIIYRRTSKEWDNSSTSFVDYYIPPPNPRIGNKVNIFAGFKTNLFNYDIDY